MSLRSILASEMMLPFSILGAKKNPLNKAIEDYLFDRRRKPASTKEIWTALQKNLFDERALDDWLYNRRKPRYN